MTVRLSHTDQQIVDALQARDSKAIRLIYQLYGTNLLGLIFRIVGEQNLAEDILQESLVKVWQKSDTFDPQKGSLFTWLLNICRNSSIDKRRSAGFRKQAATQSGDNLVSVVDEANSYSFNPDRIGIREWVDKLSPEQVEVIETVYFSGFSHREAAKKLDIPLGTLKTRIRTALSQLRKWTQG